jgi:ribonuclease III
VKLGADLAAFSRRLGHDFQTPRLLIESVTHGSVMGAARADNQRLEFLGDRVLGLIIAQALLDADPGATEGQIAPRFNALVRRETCADVARAMGLGEVLKLGRGEMTTGGRRKDALLADAMEAVIAAVYLDAGLDAARAIVLRHWATRIGQAPDDARDAKTALQEWAQGQGNPPPVYDTIRAEGPPHQPVFTIAVTLADGRRAEAQAGAKRAAEQLAAASMLKELGL